MSFSNIRTENTYETITIEIVRCSELCTLSKEKKDRGR